MNSQRRIQAILASLLVLATVMTTPTRAQVGAMKPAAVVDGTAITMAEVETVLKQAGPPTTPPTELQRRQMQHDAVELLINDLIFQQYMRRTGPRIEVAEVDKKVAEIAASMSKQGKTLQDFLKESGQNEAQLRVELVTMLQWAAYVRDHFTETDVRKYYDGNREFFDRVAVRASHIVMRLAPNAAGGERQAVLTKMEALRRDILAGKITFANAAKQYSQDSSAANGGDIGYFPRKLVVDELYAQTAFAMKPNQLSNVIENDFGMYLILVTDRKPGNPSDYNQIKDAVRDFCIEEARLNLVVQQRKKAQVQVNLQ